MLYPTLCAPFASILTGLALHRFPGRLSSGQQLGSFFMLVGTLAMILMTMETRVRSEAWYALHLVWIHLGMGVLFISSLLDVLSVSGKGQL